MNYEQHRTDNRRPLILIVFRWNPIRMMMIDYLVVVDYYLLEVMSCCSVVSRMMNLFVIVYLHDYYDAAHYCTATRSTIIITPVIHHIHSIDIGAVLSPCPLKAQYCRSTRSRRI